jgi:hypothetical protein
MRLDSGQGTVWLAIFVTAMKCLQFGNEQQVHQGKTAARLKERGCMPCLNYMVISWHMQSFRIAGI